MCSDAWKDDFYRKYFDPNPVMSEQGRLLLWEKRWALTSLCKYFRPDENALHSLNEFSNWASHPIRFQDPTDTKWFTIDPSGWKTDSIQYELVESFQNHDTNVDIGNDIALIRNILRICSYTTSPYLPYLWDMFSQQSEGFCLEYDLCNMDPQLRSETIKKLYPMIYSQKKPDISYYLSKIKPDGVNYLASLVSILKSKKYSQEHEWRMIYLDLSGNAHFATEEEIDEAFAQRDNPVNPTYFEIYDGSYAEQMIPSKIYFGEHMSSESKTKLYNQLAKKGIECREIVQTHYYGALTSRLYSIE